MSFGGRTMTEAEQFRVTRWGIPGWTAILSAWAFAIIDIALTSPHAPNPLQVPVVELLKSTTAVSAAVAAVLAAAAGVPLGFCIYQAYFWLRWNSPVSRDGFLPPFVVGRQDDLDRTMRDITPTEIASADPWRERWVSHPLFRLDHGWKWRYIDNLFTEAAQHIDAKLRGVSVFDRHRALLDHMHTLGASLAGIYLGYLAYLLAKARLQSAPFTLNLVFTVAALAVLVLLLDWEDRAKKALERAAGADLQTHDDRLANEILPSRLRRRLHISLRVSHPSVMFLIVVFSFLYAGSPSPYNLVSANPLSLRLLVPAALVVAWCFAKANGPRDIVITETVLLALFIVGAYVAAVSGWVAALSPDWPFLWSILAFTLANLAFLKNRQNARDDLIALEHYTLRRFLGEGQSEGQAKSSTGGVNDGSPASGCS